MIDVLRISLNCLFILVALAGFITCAYETIFGKHTGRHRYPGLIRHLKRSRR